MATIKAIETVYNGYRFRSRLEARWAVFFDALGVRYEYEKEGFDFGNDILYLPDFYLPNPECWIEIKPENPSKKEIEKAGLLAAHSKMWVNMLCGNPYPGEFDAWKFRHKYPDDEYAKLLNRAIEEKDDYLFRILLSSNCYQYYLEDFKKKAIENNFERIWLDSYAQPYNVWKTGDICYCPHHRTLSFGIKIFKDDFIQCPYCGDVHQCNDEVNYLHTYGRCYECEKLDTPRLCDPDECVKNDFLISAYTAARQARFERGK